jgi:DNA segregation ATPase FtsK/SpoIIIE, S-DNA-T family
LCLLIYDLLKVVRIALKYWVPSQYSFVAIGPLPNFARVGEKMIEWVIIPALMAGAAFIPKTKPNDRKIIELIFKNVGYGIRDKEGKLQIPKFKRKEVIYEGLKLIASKFSSSCTACQKEIEKGDLAYHLAGGKTIYHKKCVPADSYPRLGDTYKFSIIPGQAASSMRQKEKEARVFTDGLQKPIEIEYKKLLHIHVYDEELPEMVPYELLPPMESKWAVPIGKAVHGLVWHNFDHTPHMTGAGTTRFGKTVLLRMIMTYLIENHPEDVEFYIIDLKGGLEFGRYECLWQVKAVAAGPEEALELLTYLTNKIPDVEKGERHGLLEHEYADFRKKNISNIVDTNIKRRRFIIVDEGAQLAPDGGLMHRSDIKRLMDCQSKLSRIAAVGGALGYRLIFATQYPTADTLPRQIKQNADAKISFRLPSGYASGVAIDDYGAEELPSDIKGRALFKTHELKEMQVPFISHEQMWERLAKYQEPTILEGVPESVVEYPEKNHEAGGNITKF